MRPGAWLLLQVIDLVGGYFGWSPVIGQVATVLVAVGFLAALVLAWYHGEQGAQRVSGPELVMMTGILVLAGAAVAFVGSPAPAARPAADDAAPAAVPAPVAIRSGSSGR